MSSRNFLLVFVIVFCITRVVNNENVTGFWPPTQGDGEGNSKPRSYVNVSYVTELTTTMKEPSKSKVPQALPKQAEKEISDSGIDNFKPAASLIDVHNVTEISLNPDTPHHNHSESFYSSIKTMKERLSLDNGAVKRTFYVVAGLTGIVLLYFMIKGISMKRKPRVPRYGLLAERELEAFDDGEDEDEDTTLFDAARYKKKSRGP